MIEALPTVRLIADCGMAMLIWLVQLVIYPAFPVIAPDHFKSWHSTYTMTIARIVIPLMFAQLFCILLSCFYSRSTGNGVALISVIAAWVVTFSISLPCHQRLKEQGPEPKTIARLLQTNWYRTIAWNIVLIAGFFA